jgi:hypothetical protein
MEKNTVKINRAPVLTLWGSVVAERMGYDRDTALTFGKAVAGLNAQSKGRMLGVFGPPKAPEPGKKPKKVGLGEEFWVEVCGRGVPAKKTENGVRAVVKDEPIDPAKVEKYLGKAFGDSLDAERDAMNDLAELFEPADLEEKSYGLYEEFRPKIASGKRGWGQKGTLDLDLIRSLGKRDT